MTAPAERPEVGVELPERLPEPSPAGWRALLGVLVDRAESELGPDWRSRLSETEDVA